MKRKDAEITKAQIGDAQEEKLNPQEASAEEAADAAAEKTEGAEAAKSDLEVRRAQLEEAERAVARAKEDIEASKQRVNEANRDIAQARKAVAEQKKQVKVAERAEKRQKRQDAIAKTKDDLQRELEKRLQSLHHSKAEMSEKMNQLLSGELKTMKKWEKTRAAEMMAIFARHNFYANGFTPVELRTTLEDLGPTYVKIGQIMSSRVDLLPVSYCKELETLRQNVKELDPQIARAAIEQETGRKIEDIFSEFRDKPLGSASIGQAHYAVLKDGTRVVAKVQRPLIADMMRKDFKLLKKLATAVNVVQEANEDSEQMVDLLSVIEELEKVENEELDFRVEAEHTKFFKENCIDDEEKITCPTVIDELTTERLFTMTFVDGYSISKRDRLIADGYDPEQIGSVIVDNYLHQVLDVGTFHADPHQGNIMVSHGKPVWIDFGMIGRISEADVNILQSLILSLIDRDMDALVNAIMSMGASSPQTNRGKLVEDADAMMDKYMNVTNLQDLDLSTLLDEVMALAEKHHISLPGKYTMLVRSIATIEGVIEQLCPELNLFQQVTDRLLERVKKNLDVKAELVSAGKDLLAQGKKVSRMPVLAYDALNNLVKGRMKVNMEPTGYEDMLDDLHTGVRNIVLAVFACVLFLGSSILSSVDIQPKTPSGQPLIAAVGIIFSIALGIYTIRRMTKKK